MYTRYTILYIALCLCRTPWSDSHVCASPSKPSPSVLGHSSPRVGFPALFEVSRVDTLLESRFLFDDVIFVICSSRGGRGRRDVHEPRGHSPPSPSPARGAAAWRRAAGQGDAAGARGCCPRPRLCKAVEQHQLKLSRRVKLPSLCVPPPPARGLLRRPPAASGERKRTSCP